MQLQNQEACVNAAIYYERSKGPTFGRVDKPDLCIAGNANRRRSSTCSSSYLGQSYEYPRGPQGQEDPFFLTGSQNFIVTDYEVFGLYI